MFRPVAPKGHVEGCRCAVCAPDLQKRADALAAGRRKRADNVAARRAGGSGENGERSRSSRRVERVRIGEAAKTGAKPRKRASTKRAGRTDPPPAAPPASSGGFVDRALGWLTSD